MSLNVLALPRAEERKVYSQEGWDYNPVTKSIIFFTMAVDLGEITEKNWEEFYNRVYVWQKIYGPMFRHSDGKAVVVSPEDVVNHIGMKTNVINRTKIQFLKKIGQLLDEDAERDIKKWRTQNEERIQKLITSS